MEYSRQESTNSESQTTAAESSPRKSFLLRIRCCLCITDFSDAEDREIPSNQVVVEPRSSPYLSGSLVGLSGQPTSELIATQNRIQLVPEAGVGLGFLSNTATERRYSTSEVAMAGMQSAFEFALTIAKKERAMSTGAVSRRSSILSSMSKRAYGFTLSFLKRQSSSSFRQSNFEGHFPEVFDRLTLAAANILESAIWTGNSEMIRIIAERWVDSLNKLISLPNFGEQMIERVVDERARLFKEILINPALGTDERFRGAVGIARVGVELLFTAIRLGPRYKKLCFVLSKLWVFGLIRVEELEEEGQKHVWKLIEIYTAKFVHTAESKDQLHTGIWAEVAVEVLRASVSYPNKRILHKITRECVKQWYQGIECQMGDVMLGLLVRKWVEFQRCVIDNRRNEAVGLAVVAMGLLQAAIQQRIDAVVERLLPRVIEGFEWSMGFYDGNTTSISEIGVVDQLSAEEGEEEETERKQSESAALHNYYSQEEGRENGDREIVEAIASLFAVTEVYDPNRLRLLALKILDIIEAISDQRRKILTSLLRQRIQVTRKGTHSPELQLQLMYLSTAIVYFLNVALVEEANEITKTSRPRALVALKGLAEALPRSITARDDFSRYERAISVLRS
ncbi:hypothetical protein PT974_03100 [Cladobotryum mycophilum]|uniref:Uncharacterized protein n=1 Tax=Cladobotryum mycophilum TaxID=491253 RepID=A0ABR0SRG3_9HYPO